MNTRLLLNSALLVALAGTAAAQSTATAGPDAGDALRVVTDREAPAFELQGAPGERVLLLVGAPRTAAPRSGCRVEPLAARWVELDPLGRGRLALPAPGRPVFAQAWQPPRPGAATPAGRWSDLAVALPGGQLASTAKPGDLVITEFLKDPTDVADTSGEWVEVRNLLPWRLDLSGAVLSDASGAAYVFDNGGAPLYLRPHEDWVFGANTDPATNGGVTVDWAWSGFSLRNSSDEIFLHDRFGNLMDAVVYDDGVLWPDTPGMSISLDPTVLDTTLNDDPAHWCHASSVTGGGADTGTPGAPNDVCP
ncbi:MAG: lamin tail domain-containing protein [Planctomycetes bacterium]|nr:lamin tail domain-containing protein [Planctomycetota bacterium]